MVHYMIQLAQGILGIMDDVEQQTGKRDGSASERLRSVVTHGSALLEELQRLDPRDFLPDARIEFIYARLDLELWQKRWEPPHGSGTFVNLFNQEPQAREETRGLFKRVIAVLEKYGGEGWRAQTRSFSFINDSELRQIIERDYKELVLVLFPGGAWKSTVIMAGSILEAILYGLLTADAAAIARANGSSKAPKERGVVKDIADGDWKLHSLIEVAADLRLLPADRAKTFDQVLRDYRNFVHPKKEIRSGHPCREGEAQLAMGGLNAVCDLLERP